MIPDHFETDRLTVRHWQHSLADKAIRRSLEADLASMLTPVVLQHLPPSLHLSANADISNWVDDRAAESEVLLVKATVSQQLIGLLILAADTVPAKIATIHLGYLLSEIAWGKGYASELIAGLVTALRNQAPIRLIGGVGNSNPASARVLEKAGFSEADATNTTDTASYHRAIEGE